MADDSQPQAQPQAQEQNFYRQYLQSTAPDGSTTIREIVSPNLLDHDAAVAAEKQAGYTFQNFVDPARMSGVRTPAAPPAPAQPEAPLLPSTVVPTSGAVPTGYTPPGAPAEPGSSPWLNLIPPAMATVGPLALSIAQPEIGVPMWLASGALAAGGGGAGEAVREKLAGEELSPRNIAEQAAVSGATDVAMGPITKYALGPIARFTTNKLGRVLGAAEELGPVLTSEGTTVAAPAATLPPPPLRVTGVHTLDLAAAPSTEALNTHIQALAAQATAEERPALAAAWVASVRQRATDVGNPVTYMRAAYEGLGEETQRALFGSGKGAFERMLDTAWSGAPGEVRDLIEGATATGGISAGAHYGAHYAGIPAFGVPTATGIRTAADLTAPFAARTMLVSPGAAQFGAGLSRVGGVAGPAVSDLAAQSVAERARQAGLPTF